MALRFDMHVHTSRYSPDSTLDPEALVDRAVAAGLDGVVITEHHHGWPRADLAALVEESEHPGFLLFAGFEYTSLRGDVLIYGIDAERVAEFPPFALSPGEAIRRAHECGAICAAAHPTRAGLGFDEGILELPLDAMEVQSVNLNRNEQRLARNLARDLCVQGFASSDAHRLEDVGRYSTDFLAPIQSMGDLIDSVKDGKFRIVVS